MLFFIVSLNFKFQSEVGEHMETMPSGRSLRRNLQRY